MSQSILDEKPANGGRDDFCYELSGPKRPYWLDLAWKAKCPDCGQRVELCMKRGGSLIYYAWHSLPGTSGFINPMVYSINVVPCKRSHTIYEGPLPLLDAEGQLTAFTIKKLQDAAKTNKDNVAVCSELVAWLRSV